MTDINFFKHFDLLADQPDAVAKMRKLVLQLAMKGWLSQGSHADWKQVRLDELGDWALGSGFPTAEQGHTDKPILFAKVSDMNLFGNEKFLTTANNTIDDATAQRLRVKVHPPGTVIFPKIGGAIATNKRRLLVRPTAIDNNCLGIIPGAAVNQEWLFLFLTSIDFAHYQSGTSVPALNQSRLGEIPVLVPPLAEQRRIVAKVDELMTLCDELDQRQQARHAARTRLTESAFHHLTAAKDQADLRRRFDFVIRHSSLELEDIPQLRQAILQLAVQGRLVRQDPKDEPVSKQLSEIENSRSLLVQRGLMKKNFTLPEVETNEMPYQIPLSWKWVRVGTVGLTQTGSTPPTANRDYFGDFIPFVKPAGLTEREINYGGDGLSEAGVKQSTFIPANSVLMVCIGGSIGKTNLNMRDVCCNQQINAITPFSKTESHYIMFCMMAAWFQSQVKRDAGQTTLPIISKGKWERLPFPLPPVAEQKRIVARVEELLRQCDALEALLRQTRTVGERLLDSTLHHLLAE